MSTTTPRIVTPEPGPLTKEIAGIIKGRMARFDVTQAEMAEEVGVNQSQLSKMIRGLRHINIDQFEIMCHVLGLDCRTVMEEAELATLNRGEWPTVNYLVLEGSRVYPDQPSI